MSVAIAVAIALSLASFSNAGTLVDFKPVPTSPTLPEFVFNGPPGSPSLQAGPGAQGNGDGETLPPTLQGEGGLDAETPFVIPGIPGGVVNVGAGTTLFHDTTLVLNGLAVNGAAIPVLPTTTIVQPLGAGSFQLFSTDPVGPNGPVLLLSGSIGTPTFVVGTGGSGAAINSSSVSYTGGAIFNALVGSGASAANNSLSFSMVDVTPGFAIVGNILGNFTANGTGLFDFTPVPEPTLALLVLAAVGGFAIGRRR
jgi:hypothetical protein